jgi:hypothetical protein
MLAKNWRPCTQLAASGCKICRRVSNGLHPSGGWLEKSSLYLTQRLIQSCDGRGGSGVSNVKPTFSNSKKINYIHF